MKSLVIAVMMFLGSLQAHGLQQIKVTASGYQAPNHPKNTLDGREDTRWSCQGTCWIKYDLGHVMYVYNGWIWWRNIEKRRQFFTIETSVDGTHWTLSFEGQTEVPTSEYPGPHGHLFDDEFRYVRITGMGNTFNNWNSIGEVEFNSTYSGLALHAYLAPSVDIQASDVVDNNYAYYADDGDELSFWTGGNIGSYLEVELDGVHLVKKVDITWMNGHTRIQTYAIDVSIDGVNFDRVYTGESAGNTRNSESTVLDDVSPARYVRIVGLGNNAKKAASRSKISIIEMRIYAVEYPDGYTSR